MGWFFAIRQYNTARLQCSESHTLPDCESAHNKHTELISSLLPARRTRWVNAIPNPLNSGWYDNWTWTRAVVWTLIVRLLIYRAFPIHVWMIDEVAVSFGTEVADRLIVQGKWIKTNNLQTALLEMRSSKNPQSLPEENMASIEQIPSDPISMNFHASSFDFYLFGFRPKSNHPST